MGQLKRQLVMWSAIVVTAAVLPGLSLADTASPQHGGGEHGGGHHGRGDHGHHHGDAKLSVAGRAISRGATDSYGLQIRGASGEQPTDAGGFVHFVHRSKGVMEDLAGEITCLSKDSSGAVKMSGTITSSGKRTKDNKSGLSPADDMAFVEELLSSDQGVAEPVRHGRDGRGRRGGGELAGKDFAFTIQVTGKPQKFSQPAIGDKGTLTPCAGGGTPTLEVTRGRFRAHDADSDGEGHDHHHGWRHGWHD